MNIGIDVRTIGKKRTGDEVYTRHLISYIREHPQLNATYFLFTDRDNSDDTILHDLPVHMKLIILRPAHKLLWTMIALSKALFTYHIDLLHVHYITPLFTPAWTRVITTIHDVSWKEYPNLVTLKDRAILNILIPLSIRKATHIITVSNHSKRAINNYFPQSIGKVSVIHNGGYLPVDINQYSHPNLSFPQIGKTPYFLYIGTLQPRKNVPFLIEQFLLAKDIYQFPHNLVIVGGLKAHNFDTKLKAYQNNDNIIFTDYVSEEDKYKLLAHCYAFCFPSLFEGFGIPVIEAMSFGKPVIASHASSLPEIIGNAGKTISVNDQVRWQRAFQDLVVSAEEYQDLSFASKHTSQKYTWTKMGKATLSVYDKVIHRQ
jgi:glycosyltransferase involved in cell wall biosynthesis